MLSKTSSSVEGEVEDSDVELLSCRHLVDLAPRDRADVAELLRDDDVGLDLLPDVGVDGVQRLPVRGRFGDGLVDLDTRQIASPEERRRDLRPLRGLRRPVAPCVTPTTWSPSPTAKRTSVAPGTSEQIRTGPP